MARRVRGQTKKYSLPDQVKVDTDEKEKKYKQKKYREQVEKAGGYVVYADEWDKIDPGLKKHMFKFHKGGIVTGPTNEVPAILERGELVIPKELAGRFTQSKVNLLEIDLPTIKKEPTSNQVNPPLPETTEVQYISSINPLNSYMTTTPELHGICA